MKNDLYSTLMIPHAQLNVVYARWDLISHQCEILRSLILPPVNDMSEALVLICIHNTYTYKQTTLQKIPFRT